MNKEAQFSKLAFLTFFILASSIPCYGAKKEGEKFRFLTPEELRQLNRALDEITETWWEFSSNPAPSKKERSFFPTENGNNSFVRPEKPKESFKDIAGNEDAKKALMGLLSLIKDSTRYEKLGAQVPRGILLEGPPGTGKTLLARALAHEADCAFFSVSAAEFFSSGLRGDSVSKVDQLFAEAQKNAPAIMFIDEIDAIGAVSRDAQDLGGGAHQENKSVLTKFLTYMDGFVQNKTPIFVIGATNLVYALDKAFKRRFDRIIAVPLPKQNERKEILKLYLKKLTLDKGVTLEDVAESYSRISEGWSGSDLRNFVNQAALIAGDERSNSVAIAHFKTAFTQKRN